EHRVTLREGATLHVLAREPDRETFLEQCAESELLGRCPGDALALLDRLAPRIEHALQGAMRLECLRHLGELEADLLQLRQVVARLAAARVLLVPGNTQMRPLASGHS